MTDERLWEHVTARNAGADGLFVYAVSSTGVFCRPSCPSRRPHRVNVMFFPDAAMAEGAGFRACLRCRPDESRNTSEALGASGASGADGARLAGSAAVDRVRRVCRLIAAAPASRWDRARLVKAGGATVAQLQRGFRQVLGLSPRDYVAACRRRRFLDTIRAGAAVTDAIYETGYGSPSRVYGAIQLPGMTPATYGRGGAGATLRWASAASPAGRILVAGTHRGLCFVELGDSDRDLQAGLRKEFPRATIDPAPSRDLAPWIAAALAVARSKPIPANVPVDIRGTAFQWRVWRALTRIPIGETRSYRDVARAIGQPTAARAVARACATNPLALVVPCHRVIGQDGKTGGYRWGGKVKVRLLEREEIE